MRRIVDLVRDHYQALGAEPRPGVSSSDLAAFEAARGFRLPPPMAEFYRAIDGLDAGVPDFGFQALQLWPLAELTRVTEGVAIYRGVPDYGPIRHSLPDADRYLAFGDAMCWSHVIATRLTREAGPVLWISGAAYAVVAATFEEFWLRYVENPAAVLWPGREQLVFAPTRPG